MDEAEIPSLGIDGSAFLLHQMAGKQSNNVSLQKSTFLGQKDIETEIFVKGTFCLKKYWVLTTFIRLFVNISLPDQMARNNDSLKLTLDTVHFACIRDLQAQTIL